MLNENPKKVKIEYCWDGHTLVEECVESFEQLEHRLQELKKRSGELAGKKQCVYTVDVVIENTGRMSVALDENCILMFYDEVDDCYLTSLGNPSAEGFTEALYDFGQLAEQPNKYIVQYNDALAVLKDWIVSKKLNTRISWTDEID
ncbi:MAG: hypothetical protein FWG66_16290 [Spirochaetes bacterium]|nr:hypothetical protein [Spirochaetota bacterium]